jgi:hypothetical protein
VNRSIISLFVALAMIVPAIALAEDPPPTPAQIEKAKKAFQEGKKFHEQKKLPEAIEKFKESYTLSKNPLLLYNIGLTMDEAQMEDLALFYYRKFLTDAPPDAAQRAEVDARVKVLSAKFNPAGTGTPPAGTGTTGTEPVKPPVETGPKKPLVIKPVGTYSATDVQHEIVDVAPPARPLDVTAFVPEDSGFTVTLFFRTTGEGSFVSKEMKWRYKELVGRIPAPKMIGNSVQYYIEAKDTAGTVVHRSGKSTSPHLITLEKGAPERFYPDFSEEGAAKVTEEDIKARDIEEDDPLNRGKKTKKTTASASGDVIVQPVDDVPGNGFRDVGSSKFKVMKWGSTAAAATFIGLGVFSYLQAKAYATQVEDDANECGAPPCRTFDDSAAGWESTGKTFNTLTNVSIGVGAVAALVAGYYWYKELTAKKRGELKVGKAGASPETTWSLVPAVGAERDGDTFSFGGTAVKRF